MSEQVIDNALLVKVGGSLLTKKHDGFEELDPAAFRHLGNEILTARRRGRAIGIVSSAAITGGMQETNRQGRPDKLTELPELQRLASVGWWKVVEQWRRVSQGRRIAEFLFTASQLDFKAPEEHQGIRTLHTAMWHGDIPVINENDPVAPEEILLGDNDRLAALVAACMGRYALFGSGIELVNLSNVDGFYLDEDDSSTRVPLIRYSELDRYEHLALGTGSSSNSGGMATKFQAARIALPEGVAMYIANGREPNVIERTLAGEIGTKFVYDHMAA